MSSPRPVRSAYWPGLLYMARKHNEQRYLCTSTCSRRRTELSPLLEDRVPSLICSVRLCRTPIKPECAVNMTSRHQRSLRFHFTCSAIYLRPSLKITAILARNSHKISTKVPNLLLYWFRISKWFNIALIHITMTCSTTLRDPKWYYHQFLLLIACGPRRSSIFRKI